MKGSEKSTVLTNINREILFDWLRRLCLQNMTTLPRNSLLPEEIIELIFKEWMCKMVFILFYFILFYFILFIYFIQDFTSVTKNYFDCFKTFLCSVNINKDRIKLTSNNIHQFEVRK